MRLVTPFLSAVLAVPTPAAASAPVSLSLSVSSATPASNLPWKAMGALPWQMDVPGPPPAPYAQAPTQSYLPLTARLAPDGALRITDAKGIIRMRTGLPGRPLKAWRDWGIPVPDLFAPILFSERSPLQRGIGGLPVGTPDFRGALEGLLWIMDDDETILTVIHPATSQVAYLPLPGGQGLTLGFYPDHLEVQEAQPPTGVREGAATWSLHWLALLPQFVQLGKDRDVDRPRGTALLPFPKDP